MAIGNTIGALRVVIGADTSGLKKGATDAQKSLGGINKAALPAIAAIAAVGAAATAASAKLLSMARDEMKVIDSQAKLSRAIGGTVDGLRAFKLAAEDMGISGVESSLNRMNRRLGAAEFGAGAAAATVKRLGLDLKALADMDIQDRMASIADTIQASGMSAQQAARHLQNLGFQQEGVAELFMQGGDAIRSATGALKDYGLSVSQLDAERIESINDSFTRISRVFDGIKTQLSIALAPTIERAASLMETLARAVSSATPYIGAMVDGFVSLAEHIAVAAAAATAFFAPAIISGIGTFTTAVGVGAVGAVRALTAAIAANPIGAIATALVAAGYAAYKFRDQISEAIGIDVVEVAKTAANTVINSFVAAYEDIKFIWNNFGDMMGAAVVGGVNAAIRALNTLIEGSLSGINSIVTAVNKIPGVEVGKIGDRAKIDLLDNEYSARLVSAVEERNQKIAAIMSTDRFSGSVSDSAPEFSTPTSSVGGGFGGDGDEESTGGSAAKKESDQLQQRLDNLREFLATREELEVKAGIDRVNLIGEALDAGLVSEKEHNQMLYEVADKFYDSMTELREEKYREQRDKLEELNELGLVEDTEYHEQLMELLEEQEQEKTEALLEAMERRKEMLDEMRDDGDIDEEEHQARMEALEAEHQDALTRLVASGAQARLRESQIESKNRQEVMSGMMNNLMQLMNSGNKEMFRIGKIAAIANALLKARESIPAAYAAGAKVGGPALGAAFAATAAAATAAQVAQVKSTSFGDGGSVSTSTGSGAGNIGARPTDRIPNDPEPSAPASEPKHARVTIQLQGESYSRQQVRDLIEQINEATADGAQLRLE